MRLSCEHVHVFLKTLGRFNGVGPWEIVYHFTENESEELMSLYVSFLFSRFLRDDFLPRNTPPYLDIHISFFVHVL